MAERIIINDVGPRDGLQNQAKILTITERVQLIRALQAAQVGHIEVGAFVSPKAVPAMAGTDEVLAKLDQDQAEFSVLIPNQRGYEMALAAGARTMAMVLYASDGMAQKNVRMSRQQAEEATLEILQRSKQDGVEIIATIAVAFECPFDGPTDPAVVRASAEKFIDAGVSNFVVADTIGAANPAQVTRMMQDLVRDNGAAPLSCHFHDTRALGLANVYAAVEAGIRRFDASIAGLGGCPFAPGATGNIATEDTVMLLHSMGFDTGIDLDNLMAASDLAQEITGSAPGGRSKPWLKPFLANQKPENLINDKLREQR